MQHRELIATAFRIGGLVLGIPSALAFAYCGYGAASLYFSRPQVTPSGKTGVQLIDWFVLGARIFGKVFEFFGGAVEWVLTMLTVASFGCLVFAVLLYFTGRGLHTGRGIARVMGVLLAILPMFISFLVITSVRKPLPVAFASVIFALSGYVIWVLGWRFAG